MSLNFQKTIIQFVFNKISKFDATMIKTNNQVVNIMPVEEWKYCASIRLEKILIAHDGLTLWHIKKISCDGCRHRQEY